MAELDHQSVEGLIALVERYEEALRYIARPTMGMQTNDDAALFARNTATNHDARLALEACIRTARVALHQS